MEDHTESLQVDYRPDQVSYDELLRVFWSRHDPSVQSPSRQYMNLVLYHDDTQRRAINRSIHGLDLPDAESPATRVEAMGTFHRAEGYHQKYYLRNDSALSTCVHGWSDRKITDSPGAKLLNGLAAGHLEAGTVFDRIREYGLSQQFESAFLETQPDSFSRRVIDTA